MKLRIGAVVIAVCLGLASGCQQNPRTQVWLETMRAEKLALEDAYYELEYEYERKVEELESCRRENDTLRKQAGRDESGGGPRIEIPGVDEPLGASRPQIESGIEIEPAAIGGHSTEQVLTIDDPIEALPIPDAMPQPTDEFSSSPPEEIGVAAPLDMRVTHIIINPYLTTGHDFDRKPGDDGISVVIEPRNADDQFVPKAGPLTIVVLDPALREQGREAAEVARWELDLEEAHARLRTNVVQGQGINLKLPWPDKSPQHAHLHVFVRFESDDGTHLDADTAIEVALPGQFSSRWTPKAPSAGPSHVLTRRDAQGADTQTRAINTNQHHPVAHFEPIAAIHPMSATDATESNDQGAGNETLNRRRASPRRPVWQPFR